ncbi:MAG: hypothetical protein WD055_04940 [Candidatus Dependentiae bacterium]
MKFLLSFLVMTSVCCASDKPSMSIEEIRKCKFRRGTQGQPIVGGELKRSKTLTPRTMEEVLKAAQLLKAEQPK